jgi:hypothetical protein
MGLMSIGRLAALGWIGVVAMAGCSGPLTEPEPVADIAQALNACEETVPATRFIDGLPAYAQCSSTTNGAIWSNNGIDTSTASQGTGWVRTQRSGGYQCTEWAWRYMHFKWGVDYQNGNAAGWCDGNLPAALAKATTPTHGDLIVFGPGICGSDGTTGHIAVIDTVNASTATVTFVEENEAGRRSAKQTCATCFLHATANDGSSSAGSGGGNNLGGAATSGGSSTAGGAASGGRSASGGAPAGGALAGGGSLVAGNSSTGGSLATSGGVSGGSGTPSGSGGTASGGAPATGGSSTWTGGAPAAGAPAPDPTSDVNSGCTVSRGVPRMATSGWLGSFALAWAGFALRRRVGLARLGARRRRALPERR